MFQGHIGRQTVTLTWAWLTIHNSGYWPVWSIAVSQRVIVDLFNHKYDKCPYWATQVLLPINLQMYIYQNLW